MIDSVSINQLNQAPGASAPGSKAVNAWPSFIPHSCQNERREPMGELDNVEEEGEDFDEWYDGKWCEICQLTIGMAKLGWCVWQNKLRAQGKECPKLISEKTDSKRERGT